MFACIFGRPDNVKFWLNRFPDWNLERKNKVVGGVALGHAVYMGPHRLELVKLLLDHGASVDHRSDLGGSILTALCECEDGSPELLQFLLDHMKTAQLNRWLKYQVQGNTLKWRNIHRLARLLTRYKLTNSGLMTSLAKDSGSTALHYAVQRGDVDVVSLLVHHGADPTIKNDLGKSPVDYCDAFPELRGALTRAIHHRDEQRTTKVSLVRRDSTATDMKFPMYLVPLNQLQRLYGGKDPRHERIEAHQKLKRRKELVRWEDLPLDAHIIFLSHEWVGWNHPDPHGIQLKTFLRVMQRLRSGEISQVQMNVFHTMIYKTNHIVRAKEWKEILNTAYVWFDWASMPQPSACPPSVTKEEKDRMGTDLGNAVRSIPAYVEKADFVVIVAPGCLHADRREFHTKLRSKTCFRTYRKRGWCVLEVFASYLSRDKEHPLLVITSKEGHPEWISTLDVLKLAVGMCDFTCCQRNHKFGDKIVECDRGITKSILEKMIESKIEHLFKITENSQARMCACFQNWWLRIDSEQEEQHSPSISSFKSFLRWNETNESEWMDRGDIPILAYAVIGNEIDVVRSLLRSKMCTKEKLNDHVFKNGLDHVKFGITANISILNIASCFSSVQVVQLLLESGADPLATDKNGIDSLMIACRSHFINFRPLYPHSYPLTHLQVFLVESKLSSFG